MGHYMDGHNMILEFATRPEAEFALQVINQIAAAWWQAQGYTVIDGQLVGKNAATGEDMPDACRTLSWAEIEEGDGTYFFPSPSSDPRFVDWRDYLPEGVTMPEDKELSDEA